MTEDDLRDWLDSLLRPLQFVAESGAESVEPVLDVLGFYVRRVRISGIPILGRGLGVVAICRSPSDLTTGASSSRAIIERLAVVSNSQFPPIRKGRGVTLGLTALVLTSGQIAVDEERLLAAALNAVPRTRVVPLGVFRIDLEREAVSFAIKRGPAGLFLEPELLADEFASRFKRFVPLMPMD